MKVPTGVVLSGDMRFPTMWYLQPTKPQVRAFASRYNSLSAKLLSGHHLEFLGLKVGCTSSSESTLAEMPHCLKSHVAAQPYTY